LVRPITEPGVQTVEIYFPGGEYEVWVPMTGSDVRKGTGWATVNITNRDVRNEVSKHQNVGMCFVVGTILSQKRWCYCQKR
jgi:hypothetical protein